MSDPDEHRRLGLPSLRPAGIVLTLYLLGFGAALVVVLQGDAVDGVVCFLPVLVAAALAMTSQADRKQYVARLLAAALFLPVGLLMWAQSQPAGGWILLAFVLMHVAALLGMILWLARFCTRIEPAAGTAAIGVDRLAWRFDALRQNARGLFDVVHQPTERAWTVHLLAGADAGRRHRMTLTIDASEQGLAVKEFMTAAGAAPSDARERDMRAPGEPFFDPSRPDAQAVWNRARQSSMIEPDRLVATQVGFEGDQVSFEFPAAFPVDDDAVITLFAAVATRSGYRWAPRLFG